MPSTLKLAVAGDTNSLNTLIVKWTPYMRKVAYKFCKNREDVEDIISDAMFRITKGIGKFDGRSSFATWISVIVRNLCFDFRRRERFDVSIEYVIEHSMEGEPYCSEHAYINDIIKALCTGKDDVVNTVIISEELRRCENVMRKMPAHLLTVLYDYCISGFEYKKIAEELNIPIGTVKGHLFRARKYMREHLELAGNNA